MIYSNNIEEYEGTTDQTKKTRTLSNDYGPKSKNNKRMIAKVKGGYVAIKNDSLEKVGKQEKVEDNNDLEKERVPLKKLRKKDDDSNFENDMQSGNENRKTRFSEKLSFEKDRKKSKFVSELKENLESEQELTDEKNKLKSMVSPSKSILKKKIETENKLGEDNIFPQNSGEENSVKHVIKHYFFCNNLII